MLNIIAIGVSGTLCAFENTPMTFVGFTHVIGISHKFCEPIAPGLEH